MTNCRQVQGADAQIQSLRARWVELIRRELPVAALRQKHWPVRLDHCFARILLDNLYGRPWREAIPAPAWRHMSPDDLAAGIDLAEAVLEGRADLRALNRRSLELRGKVVSG